MGTFSYVVDCPQGLEVGIVKTDTLLFGVNHIERGTRAYVVDVPTILPVILPGHACLELLFQELTQLPCGTAYKGKGAGRFSEASLPS
jgi:hypothetical protein